MAVYTIAGLTCGIAALLNASRLNSVSSSTLGLFPELDAIAAVVIGGMRLQGRSGRVWGTVVGVLIMGGQQHAQHAGRVELLRTRQGIIILAVVLVQGPGGRNSDSRPWLFPSPVPSSRSLPARRPSRPTTGAGR